MRDVDGRGGSATSTRTAVHASAAFWWISGGVALATTVAIINWPLLPALSSAVPGNLGDPLLNVWLLAWAARAIRGPEELWHAPIFYPHGNALAFSEPLLGLTPLAAPLLWLTGDPILSYNLTFLSLSFLTFAGAAMLIRELTGRTDVAVMVGVLIASCPYLAVSQITRIQMLTCGWGFLALAGLHRFLATGSTKAAGAFAAAYAMQAFSNTYLGIYLAVPVAMILAQASLATSALVTRRRVLIAVAALSTIAAALTPVVWTLAEVQGVFGVSRSMEETRNYSADVRSYLSVWHEQNPRWLWPEQTADRALFPGMLLLVLAIAGVVLSALQPGGMRRPVFAYVLVGAIAFVLSLGPSPAAWGHALPVPGPYQWLADVVPGFDALRAPGRFAIFVLIAMAVAAGHALTVLLAPTSRPFRVAALVLVAAVGAVQSTRTADWVAHVPPRTVDATAAYRWLADQPHGPMIELPIVSTYQRQPRVSGASLTLFYQLGSLDHGHRLVNGSSGFSPPFTEFLEGAGSPLAAVSEADEGLQLLRAVGVRYLVIHPDLYAAHAQRHAAELLAWMRQAAAHVAESRSFGETSVFVLLPSPEEAAEPQRVARVPPDAVNLDGPNPGMLHRLTDGDLGERWTTPQRAGTQLTVRLDRSRRVAGVTLHLQARSLPDYPRQLRVAGVTLEGDTVPLYAGPGALELGRRLVAAPQMPAVPLWWPAQVITALHIELAKDVRPWQWSVHELEVWEARP